MKKIFISFVFIFLLIISIFSIYIAMTQQKKMKNFELKYNTQEKLILELKKEISASKLELHPIEQAVQDCMKKENYTTASMINCVDVSIAEWSVEMEKYYNNLMDILPKQQQLLLIDSQKRWNDYKKVQWELNKKTLCEKKGSLYVTTCIGNDANIVQKRAQELSGLYYILTQ